MVLLDDEGASPCARPARAGRLGRAPEVALAPVRREHGRWHSQADLRPRARGRPFSAFSTLCLRRVLMSMTLAPFLGAGSSTSGSSILPALARFRMKAVSSPRYSSRYVDGSQGSTIC